MSNTEKRFHLFQRFGVELEYMIVDRHSLRVKPISDKIIREMKGQIAEDFVNGEVTWSNELVLHVIELKNTCPSNDLARLNDVFSTNVRYINSLLETYEACLLPTAAHPWMNPALETKLWPHDQGEIYRRYDKMFNCSGHGWSNLQSTHLNISFYDDEEFARLHTAIRVLLPIIPALSASSPILDGVYQGIYDTRLQYYQQNQGKFPTIAGNVIPERVLSRRQYRKMIYDPIRAEIAAFNGDNLLDPVWVNSRGVIARFDRGSLEIRIIDIQECPMADLAIISLIIGVLKLLVSERLAPFEMQKDWELEPLHSLFQKCIRNGSQTILANPGYLKVFDIRQEAVSARSVWKMLCEKVNEAYPQLLAPWLAHLQLIIDQGTLAERLVASLDDDFSKGNLLHLYKKLIDKLHMNQLYLP